MKQKMPKEKWRLVFTLGPDGHDVTFSLLARGVQGARAAGEKVMRKEWGKSVYSWRLVSAKVVEDG